MKKSSLAKSVRPVIAGNFMWSKRAQARCENWEPGDKTDRFVGIHDGYARLDDPVIHRRELLLNKTGDNLQVIDELLCNRTHMVEQYWHFSEDCRVLVQGAKVEAVNGENTLFLNFHSTDIDIDVYRGSEDPPMGWVSRRYDVKVPATTIVMRCRLKGTTSLRTSLNWILAKQE